MSNDDSIPFESVLEMRRAIGLLEDLSELVPVDCHSHSLLNLTTKQITEAYLGLVIEINSLSKRLEASSVKESVVTELKHQLIH